MKKKLCALILAMACVCSLGTTGASAAGMDEQEGYSTTVISGEDAIQAYLEEVRVYPCNFDGCRIQEVAAAAVRCGAESQDYKVRGG